MVDIFASYDRAVHSDFLIHWTGKDIEDDPKWYEKGHHSEVGAAVEEKYLRRLSDILTYGLWMTDEGTIAHTIGTQKIEIPGWPQCCFTELRLSESRRHAARYGRLGIGVKRPFLFRRFGRPLAYFGFGTTTNDKFLGGCASDLKDQRLLRFFKPMNSSETLNYDLYAESEWRILHFEELLADGRIVDPRNSANMQAHEYFKKLSPQSQDKLKYLVPLDGWFAMIIYPSLQVKLRAQWDSEFDVAGQIDRIKRTEDHPNAVEGLPNPARGNWPIELDLDAARHF